MNFPIYLIVGSFGLTIVSLVLLIFCSPPNNIKGILFGGSIGFFLGGMIFTGINTSYWTTTLINNNLGEYQLTDKNSSRGKFKLITRDINYYRENGVCHCPKCGWSFLTKEAEKDLFLNHHDMWVKYLEEQGGK